ncbi:MAG: phage/plasmid replication protein, II/X family [Methylococcales bacterium]|nr:phage/plasmid replication protein, II/X family [Methylococcales bacterium]
MIDWFRGEIDFLHDPIPAGRVISIDSDGSITWECVKSIDCRSSHETSLKIKSTGGDGQGRATALMIDGNLCKFLQGHNVFGSRELNTLLLLAFRKVYELHAEHLHGCSSPLLTEAKIKKGDYKVKMLDINELYDVGNDASVEAWLHAAHMRAMSRHGKSSRDKGTVYLGKTSRRWAFKFYNKHREMLSKGKSHLLPDYLRNIGLEEFIQGKLRAELRIFSKELEKHGITHGYHLTPDLINQLFNNYLGKIDMTQQATLIDEQLIKMPPRLQGTYQLWRQGADLRQLLSRPTFYRNRKELLAYGVDINSTCLAPEHNNVVPLMRIIEAVPVSIPTWAYERGLIAA